MNINNFSFIIDFLFFIFYLNIENISKYNNKAYNLSFIFILNIYFSILKKKLKSNIFFILSNSNILFI